MKRMDKYHVTGGTQSHSLLSPECKPHTHTHDGPYYKTLCCLKDINLLDLIVYGTVELRAIVEPDYVEDAPEK